MFNFLASDYPILLTLLLTIWLFVRREGSILRWMWFDRAPWARIVTRASIGLMLACVLWVAVVDNWRQMLGFMMGEKERWRSDPYLYDPPADVLRVTTFALFGLAVLGGAYLYARYARGYLMPIVLAPLALPVFYALNTFRTRFELEGPLSERGVDFTDPMQALMTFVWFAMFYCVMIVLTLSAYVIFWGPASIVVSIIYRSTIGRERVEEPDMYRLLRSRSLARREDRHPS
ncbi:MAG TPA: hypothetical protein VMM78_18880 [Thermomicrobiales bacterium]|nr:hypothetical protein [Thermomicrobiales bacterium]